jgi:hypothetical protein
MHEIVSVPTYTSHFLVRHLFEFLLEVTYHPTQMQNNFHILTWKTNILYGKYTLFYSKMCL